MKQKILTILAVLITATVLSAQNGSAPATSGNGKTKANPCACCSHEKAADATAPPCADCCKAGKCPMMSGGATGAKCPMMTNSSDSSKARLGCCGDKCPMHATHGKSHGCCCGDVG